MQQQPDDMLVIQSILQGNTHAYALLVDKYQAFVFTLVTRYIPHRETAEELAQDVFVKAYRNLAGFKGESKFSTWLYTIVHTTCLSHLRTKKNPEVLLDQDMLLYVTDSRHQEPTNNTAEQKDKKQLIDRAMATLPPEDALVITLFYQAEQSLEEIGRIMNITANNAKVKLYRARHKLREVLDKKQLSENI